MIVKLQLALSNPRQAAGLRQWSTYLRDEIFKKIKGLEKKDDAFVFAGTVIKISNSVDQSNCVLEFTLESSALNGKKLSAPPIPALVFLLGMLYLAPGREKAGLPMKFSCQVGEKVYTDTQWKEANASLQQMLPPAWYIPFTDGLMDPTQFFQRAKR